MTSQTAILPHHLTISSEGDLFDTRRLDWPNLPPVRRDYCRAFEEIETTSHLKASLRHGDCAWPGGYPLYFVTSDGGALSFATVRINLRAVLDSIRTRTDDGWRVVGCWANWEDPALYDDHTGERIPSAYAEEDAAA